MDSRTTHNASTRLPGISRTMFRASVGIQVCALAALLAAGSHASADPPCVDWVNQPLLDSRHGHAMAYDSARDVTVLFGGVSSGNANALGDTWEWNGTTWTLRSPATSPAARGFHAMAYDSARGVTVLFGGQADGNLLINTWEWDGTTWTQRNPATSPPWQAAWAPAMTYDSARGVTVLLGGSTYVPFADTWEWNGTNWTQSSPATHPASVRGHAIAYDSARGVTVLFGGTYYGGTDPNVPIQFPLAQTWEWDGTTWTQRSPATRPPARAFHAMAYDSARGVTVLFGGHDFNSSFGDAWEWDGTTWTQRSTASRPPNRNSHAMAYDSARGVTVLFGGSSGNYPHYLYLGETWEWDGTAWTQPRPATSPLPRFFHAMAYDSARDVTVLFGGYHTSVGYLGDTWEWNGTIWTQRSPATSPHARYAHAMAYDSARGVTVLFGGLGFTGDTWEWDGTTWTQRSTATSPPGRFHHAMAYDSDRGVTVLFGGESCCDDNDPNDPTYRRADTWEWNGTNWTQPSPATSPPERHQHAMAYDSARGVTVMFGGSDYNGAFDAFDDTWEWDGTIWTQRSPANSPPARYYHAMTYDNARGVTVLLGGLGRGNNILGDTWECDGTTWTQPDPATSPTARRLHAMAHDSARDVTVLFGGFDGAGRILGDTWEFGLCPCPGDLNGDRAVSLSDLTILLAHFGTPSGATLADGDLSGDGDVDLSDLTLLLANFGTICP